MQLHQITNTEMDNTITYRSLSCFCSVAIQSGYCKSIDSKTHLLTSTCENDAVKGFEEEIKTNVEIEVRSKKTTAKRNLKRKTIYNTTQSQNL